MKKVLKPVVVLVIAALLLLSGIPGLPSASAATATDFTVSTYAALLETIARQYVARDTAFTVRYNAGLSDVQNNIKYNSHLWDDIFAVDLPGTTSDLDYLQNNMSEMRISYTYSGSSAVCTFTQSYLTTTSEESYVSNTVAKILSQLDVGADSAYNKIRAIHDYIIRNVEYDFTYSRFTAYNALYSHSAVCQGYTLLMYKMLMEAGIPARIVYGEAVADGNRGAHAWNIVKIGQYWYNLDVTWDDSLESTKYFLKNSASFSDHYRDSAFTTSAFNAAYPMSPDNYDLAQEQKQVSSIAISQTNGTVFAVGDVFLLSVVVAPADATDKSLSWSSSNPGVATVDSAGCVTVNGPGIAVITVSANDGTGKSAGFTLTAQLPVTPHDWALADINALSTRGVIPLELKTAYRNDITRAEFMALIANIYEYAKGAPASSGNTPFTDIAGSQYKEQITLCYSLGIVNGKSGTLFAPDDTLTRQECAKIICSAVKAITGASIASNTVLPYTDINLISTWALPYVRYAFDNSLMLGANGAFSPQAVLSREQAMMIAERMLEKYGW